MKRYVERVENVQWLTGRLSTLPCYASVYKSQIGMSYRNSVIINGIIKVFDDSWCSSMFRLNLINEDYVHA